ncbi:hypothetical protein V5799_033853 [Amblyomma americanum]|uniref:Peptidase M13 N-terminal domain-containing protein n=1 Tax=Amblyomma americanum TaxID=6943 RepID=A0AAQ4DM49_AMBAM
MACTSYARMITQSASGSATPCHNFYRFVCDGYANSSRSVFRDHMVSFTNLVAHSLSTAVAPEEAQSAFEKAAIFYQSCVAVVTEGSSQFDQFREIMTDAGILWPRVAETPDVMASMLKMALTLNIFTLIFFTADRDRVKCSVEIWKGDVIEHLKRRRREVEAVGKYEQYYDSFFRFFEAYDGKTNASGVGALLAPVTSGDAAARFEHFLRIENIVFHYLTGRKPSMKAVFDNVTRLQRISPSIGAKRWADVFNQMMSSYTARPDNASSPLQSCSQEITVWDLQYLRALDDLLLALGRPRLHYYYGWTVVQALAPFMSYGLAVMTYGSVKAARDESPLHCLRLTETTMGLVVYERYAATDFTPATRLELHQMVNVVYSALLRMLQANPDLDPREISVDLRKLERTLLPRFELLDDKARLDRFFSNVPSMAREAFALNWIRLQRALHHMMPEVREATRSFYLSSIASSNAYTVRRAGGRGALGLAPYATLLPLYDAKVVDSIKYGGLGSMIAAATFQFFQEHLPARSRFRSLLEQRTRCYEGGPLRGLRRDPAKRTAFERAVALSFLWQAFRSPLRRRDPRWRVHGLESFSEEQLFFVASCFPLCSGYQSGAAELACNEPLRHSRDFPGAFHCPGGAPMNPRLKCSVFY